MKTRIRGAALAALAAFAMAVQPAFADDYHANSPDGLLGFAAKLFSGVLHPKHIFEGMFGGTPTPVNMTTSGAIDVTVVNPVSGGSLATNQTAVQATAGSDAPKAVAVQGVTGGKPVPISASGLPLPAGAATAAAQTGVQETHGSNTGNTTYLRDPGGNLINWGDFAPSGNATLAVTTTTAPVALPNTDGTIIVTNLGPADVSFKLGTGTPTAATTDTYLQAGRAMAIGVGANTSLAAITAAGTSTLKIVQGAGSPSMGGHGALPPSPNTIGDTGTASVGGAASACSVLTLPSGGGTYGSGQGVLNNATAGSVTNQSCTVSRYAAGPVTITGARLLSSNAAATGTFRIHFFATAPTYSSGNNVALSVAHATHFCTVEVILGATSGGLVFSDGVDGFGVPVTGAGCTRVLTSGQVIYPVMEARSASTWLAAQTFTIFPQGFN